MKINWRLTDSSNLVDKYKLKLWLSLTLCVIPEMSLTSKGRKLVRFKWRTKNKYDIYISIGKFIPVSLRVVHLNCACVWLNLTTRRDQILTRPLKWASDCARQLLPMCNLLVLANEWVLKGTNMFFLFVFVVIFCFLLLFCFALFCSRFCFWLK